MELSNDWHKRTNERLFDILSDIMKESRVRKVPKPTHGYTIAEKAPEVVTAPGVYFPVEKGQVIPLESRQLGGRVGPKKSRIEQLEEAAGIIEPTPTPAPEPAPEPPPVIPPPKGFVAPPYTGPRPWRIPKEQRQPVGIVTPPPRPTGVLQGILQKLASYAPFPIPGVTTQKEEKLIPIADIMVDKKKTPLLPRQNGGEVDPSLFKETFSVNYGNPTQEEIDAAANTALVNPTPINVSPPPSLQSFAPGTNLTPPGPSTPLTGMAEYEASARRIRGLSPETGASTVSPTKALSPTNTLTPPPFRENKRSPVFGSDQLAAYNKKYGIAQEPDLYQRLKASSGFPSTTPLFSRQGGGKVRPTLSLRSLATGARKASDYIDKTIQTIEEFPFNKMYDEMREEATKKELGGSPSPMRRGLPRKTPIFSREPGGVVSPDPLEGLSEGERKRRAALIKEAFPEEPLAPSHVPTNRPPTSSPDNMTEIVKKVETLTIPKKEFTQYPKIEAQGDLSRIRKEILPSGETHYTLPGTEGTAMVGPERFFIGDKEVPAGTLGAVSGDELARQRILREATPPELKLPETTYYQAHPEERFMDIARAENKPLMDAYQKLIEENRTRAQGFGLPMDTKAARVIQAEATRAVPELTQGVERTMALNQAIPEKYFSAGLGAGGTVTPHLVQDATGRYVYSMPPRGMRGPGVISAGIQGKMPPEDTSAWRTHEAMGKEKGWTREQILDDWNKKQVELTGKKAEITINTQTGGTTSFPNWDEGTKKQSFENFIINNQKPTFAWRDAKSRNAWEKEFNEYLLEKGKTAESVGETRFYRGAQKKALDNNEVYRVAAERFVNVIDQNAELVKKLKKQYGVNYGRLVNAAINNINQGIPGSGDLMALQQALTSLSNEVAKVESGSMGVAEVSVEQAKIWKKIHDYNLNESDLDKVLDTSKKLGEIRRRSLRETTDALRKELMEKEVKPGEASKPFEATKRPRAADFAGSPEEGSGSGAKTAEDLLKKYGVQ